MWTLIEPVRIVIKKEGIIITQDALEKNQDLAMIVMNNEEYKKKWGHNFKEVEGTRLRDRGKTTVLNDRPDEIIIPVDIKKKPKAESAPQKLPESVSTSTEVSTDGQNLNKSESGRVSPSADSKESKQGTGSRSYRRRK